MNIDVFNNNISVHTTEREASHSAEAINRGVSEVLLIGVTTLRILIHRFNIISTNLQSK